MAALPNFEQLKYLAENNPEQLEDLLHAEVNKIIAKRSGNTRKRLIGLQFQIDAQRRLSKNPMDALLRIFNMMNESVNRLNESFKPLQQTPIDYYLDTANDTHYSSAQIIPFSRS